MSPRKGLVSVIIVSYNGLAYLKTCLSSLGKQRYTAIEIIVVDNHSTDRTVEFIQKNYPDITLVQLQENTGFAEGNNRGLPYAHGDYILLLNNDTNVDPDFIGEMVSVFQKDNTIGAAQSKLLVMDHPELLDAVGAFQTPTGFLYHYGYAKHDGPKYDRQIAIYSAKGACMMMRRKALQKSLVDSTMFDPAYFAYFEETDLCHRIWMAGYKIVFVPKAVVYHKMGATSRLMDNAFVQFHSFKNRIRSYIKNFGLLFMLSVFPIHILVCFVYAALKMIQGDLSVSKAILKAMYWNAVHLPETLRMRRYIQQNIRTVSDSELWGKIMQYPPLRYYYLMTVSLENFEDLMITAV